MLFIIGIGFQDEVTISCKTGRRMVSLTIYDSVESNATGEFQLLLKNGVNVPLRKLRAPLFIGSIYDGDVINGRSCIIIYQKEYEYQRKVYLIEMNKLGKKNAGRFFIRYNPWSKQLYILAIPGPYILRLTKLYNPWNGLLKEGTGKWTVQQTSIFVHPISKNKDLNKCFQFNPIDGSLLHLIRSPRGTADQREEHFTSVEVYTTAMD
jgi:hypothetical protein